MSQERDKTSAQEMLSALDNVLPDLPGETKLAIGVVNGRVVIHFGKSVTWIGLTKEQCASLTAAVNAMANQLEGGGT